MANKYNLAVIEDSAELIGGEYKSEPCGSFGTISTFSFYANKNITSGEGGCVVTSDTKVAQYVRDARLLGVKKDTEKTGKEFNIGSFIPPWAREIVYGKQIPRS